MSRKRQSRRHTRVASLFAGIGGFDLALERMGHEIVYANEWDSYAADIYDRHFTQPVDRRDITTISAGELPEFDLLCAGFPCQAFSLGGRRRGFGEARGALFFDIARICGARRPHYLCLENVKGLLSHDRGRTFGVVLSTLDELGYSLQWQVLNSADFGVPQNRERVYLVGHLRGEPGVEVFPLGGTVSRDAPRISPRRGRRLIAYPGHTINEPDLPASTLKAGVHGVPGGEGLVRIGQTIRRLTPVEWERLQGFPDGWTEGVSDTRRYKCLGNAVTVNVVEAIARRLPI